MVKLVCFRSENNLKPSQEAYIKRVLELFRMYNSKHIDTPVEKSLTLNLDQCSKTDDEIEIMNNVPNSSVESLM